MKKTIPILALAVMVFAGCGETYPSEIETYTFDSAVIQYEYTGNVEGEATLYVRGDQKAMYKTLGDKNELELDLGDNGYYIDMDKATATKVSNPDYNVLKGMSAQEQEIFLVRKALGLRDSAEAPEPFTQKTIAGQVCNVYIISNIGSACIWDGIVLEKEVNIQDVTNKQVAVSVQTGLEIPSTKFELPANVIVQ